MVINKASKCRLCPTKEQLNKIDQTLGCCRYVYNAMLSRQQTIYRRRKEHLSYNEMQNLLPVMKQYLPWLTEVDSQALKYACRQLDNSYQKMFRKHAGYPKYKRKRDTQSYTTTKGVSIHVELTGRHKGKVKLPTIGWIKARGINIPDNAVITRATVSRNTDDKYYVSIAFKYEVPDVVTDRTSAIGLDFREGDLYCDSNNNSAGKPNNITESMARLKRAQDILSRMIESHITEYRVVGDKRYPVYDRKLSECRNIQRQRRRVAKIHKHITNQRKDFLHKQSAAITKQYDVICIEDLKVSELLLDKTDDPSAVKRRNVNRKVYDDGWCMFTQMLEYKSAWKGKHLVRVANNYPSSELCSSCGNRQDMSLEIRTYKCPACGKVLGRDHNADINIRNEGMRLWRLGNYKQSKLPVGTGKLSV